MHARRALVTPILLLALASAPARAQSQKPALLDRWLGQLGRPFVIAIAGDSGSGKSTFARGLTQTLGPDRVKTICVDDYHRLDRQGRKRAGVTALNPAATDLGRLARDLGRLRQGRSIMKPVYDHGDGTLAGPEPFTPAPIIVVEGLHPFATRALRDNVDLAVYFDPSSRVKNTWKIKRDVGERGHSEQAVRRSIRARKPDYRAHVEPQRGQADVVVRFDWSRLDGKPSQQDLRVRLRERNLRPTPRRVRRNRSGPGYALRSERRADGTGITTIDGRPPSSAMRRAERLLGRVTGVTPRIERRSATLDAARVLVAKRVLREIARRKR
jgi:uridine kinase